MELDIRLQPSRILAGGRLLILIAVCVAIVISGLAAVIKLVLLVAVPLLCWIQQKREEQICRVMLKRLSAKPDSPDIDEQLTGHGTAGTISLRNGRYLQVQLQSSSCLHWLQILTLKSHDRVRRLIVLPDSCSSQERRHLRRLLML